MCWTRAALAMARSISGLGALYSAAPLDLHNSTFAGKIPPDPDTKDKHCMKDSLIQNAPLLSSLSPDEQQQLGSSMTEMTFGKGETLTAQGQPTHRMYLIHAGWVKQSTQLEGGRTLVNNLGPGSLVGEMDVLLEEPAASTATTHSEVSVWALSQSDLQQVLD